jgi:hypothetical protein
LAVVLQGSEVPQQQAAASYFHVERTWSEFALSAFGAPGGAPTSPALAAAGIDHAASCQDCHMPVVGGRAAKMMMVTERPDLRRHDQTGGSVWLSRVLASTDEAGTVYDAEVAAILSGARYPGAKIQVAGLQGAAPALIAGSDRARTNLQRAASLELVRQTPDTVVLRIVNQTGHKLLSGFPEGRRMWLNVQFFDASGALLTEINPYAPLVVGPGTGDELEYVSGAELQATREDLVYEVALSSELTGESKTFHMVLATARYKDNRIPPQGFDISQAAARHVEPCWEGVAQPDYFTAAEYAGGYQEVSLALPPGAVSWKATLFYQTTSLEYISFLRDEIRGTANTLSSPTPSGESQAYIAQADPFFSDLKDWGEAIWQLWLRTDGAPPIAMTSAVAPPRILAGQPGPEGFSVLVQSVPGTACQLQSITALGDAAWVDIGESQTSNDGSLELVDPSSSTQPTRFYRVQVIAP